MNWGAMAAQRGYWRLPSSVRAARTWCYVPRQQPTTRGYGRELRHRAVRSLRPGSGVFRWLHVIVGITWIGLLYYFNLVQVPAFAKMDASARNEAIDKVARRALWWFRWAALATVIFGLLITGQKDYFATTSSSGRPGLSIFIGMILGIAHVPQRVGRDLAQPEARAGQRRTTR